MVHETDPVARAAAVVRDRAGAPDVALILGTGLGGLAAEIEQPIRIPYAEIPGMPRPTVVSHAGQLVCGQLGGHRIAALEGRLHFYEGYSMQEITFPVRVLRAVGCHTLIVSNACGGMNPAYLRGDVVLIDDHINLMGDNPLRGPNDERVGPRFLDLCRPYDEALLCAAESAAARAGIRAHRGVYAAVAGPNLETRAEYRFLRTIGADIVGMSTVPEVLVARHGGMRVLGLSLVTDLCFPESLQPVAIDEILAVAAAAEPRLRRLVRDVVSSLPAPPP